MDAFQEPGVEDVVGVFGSQLGKTEAINNVLAYFMRRDPCPILVVQPTLDLARSWSKLRLVPMIRDTPILRDAIGDPKSKKTGQEILEKQYPGGQLAIAGANAPGGLAGRPRRIVLGDELDRWPASAGSEGDPVELAQKRTSNFWNRVRGWISSPGNENDSRIWALWELSDQRRYFVPCPHCDESQVLEWKGVHWPSGLDDDQAAELARYVCDGCGVEWTEPERHLAVSRGEWKAERETATVAGFHLNALNSPWLSIPDLAREWLRAQGNPEALKVFVNTRLAETWKDVKLDLDLEALLRRREDYGPKVPEEVLAITAGVDVQDDRLELEVVGWGRRGHSWSLGYHVIHGDPEQILEPDPRDPHADRRLDEILGQVLEREDGARLRIAATCVDSGGHFTESVYRFAKRRARRRVYAIKGKEGEGRPLWPKRSRRTSKKNVGRVPVHILGVDTGKQSLLHRLSVSDPEKPGFCHFPTRPEYDEEFFAQLTAEVPEPAKYHRGRKMPRRFRLVHSRNEALDCRVYATAALASLSPNWERLEANLEKLRVELAASTRESDEPDLEKTPDQAEPVPPPKSAPMPELEIEPPAVETTADKMEKNALRARRARSNGRGRRR